MLRTSMLIKARCVRDEYGLPSAASGTGPKATAELSRARRARDETYILSVDYMRPAGPMRGCLPHIWCGPTRVVVSCNQLSNGEFSVSSGETAPGIGHVAVADLLSGLTARVCDSTVYRICLNTDS